MKVRFAIYRTALTACACISAILSAPLAKASLITGSATQNLFGGLNGISNSSISSKLSTEYATYKAQRVGNLGSASYIKGDGSPVTVLTEGMGYGMMIAVQMNDHTLFDRLYAFVQTKMLFTDSTGQYAYAKGYHRWKVNADGTQNSSGNFVAPDGEEWIAAALSLAARRWTTGNYNYATEAKNLWHSMMYPQISYGGYFISPNTGDAGYHIVMFGPYNNFTDPSYIVPGFYALVSDTIGGSDATAYADICSKGHNFLQSTPANPSNSSQNWGLHPDYATWSGAPTQSNSSDTYGPVFSYDAFRTTMNMAVEVGWTGNTSGYYWQVATRRQDQFYYYGNTVGATVGLGVGGFTYGQLVNNGMPVSLIAPNACASALYTWSNTERAYFTNQLWTTYHPSDYYGDNLYMLGLLICGGQFKNAW